MSITEIRTNKQEKNLNYARTQDLVEQLHIFEKQMDWSIFEILEVSEISNLFYLGLEKILSLSSLLLTTSCFIQLLRRVVDWLLLKREK